jgi:hypothetical protein
MGMHDRGFPQGPWGAFRKKGVSLHSALIYKTCASNVLTRARGDERHVAGAVFQNVIMLEACGDSVSTVTVSALVPRHATKWPHPLHSSADLTPLYSMIKVTESTGIKPAGV